MLNTTKKQKSEKPNFSQSESFAREKSSGQNLNYFQQTLAESRI